MKMVLIRTPQVSPPQLLRPTESYLSFKKEMYIDVWAEVVRQIGGEGEVWYLGAKENKTEEYDGLTLRMVQDTIWLPSGGLDVIWFRSLNPLYELLRNRYSRAFKMYYGGGFGKVVHKPALWDMVLVDTGEQYKTVKKKGPKVRVHLWAKPAARWFEQFDRSVDEKEFDVVLCASRGTENKGLDWAAKYLPRGTSVLRIGPPDEWFEQAHIKGHLQVEFTGYVQNYEVPGHMLRGKVGLACDPGKYDSGPRIIPEYLSLGIPVLIRSGIHCNTKAYCQPTSAEVVTSDTLADGLRRLSQISIHKVLGFYNYKLSLSKVAERIVETIKG